MTNTVTFRAGPLCILSFYEVDFALIFQSTNNIQNVQLSHKANYVEFSSLAKFLHSS
jgi:hypothetical protein